MQFFYRFLKLVYSLKPFSQKSAQMTSLWGQVKVDMTASNSFSMSRSSVAWLARRCARNSMIAGSNRAWRKNFSLFYNVRIFNGEKQYFNWNLLYLIQKVSVYSKVLNWTPSCRFFAVKFNGFLECIERVTIQLKKWTKVFHFNYLNM